MQKYANLEVLELEKCCQNAYFLAKFRFDTAENEPAKNFANFGKFANFANPNPGTHRRSSRRPQRTEPRPLAQARREGSARLLGATCNHESATQGHFGRASSPSQELAVLPEHTG